MLNFFDKVWAIKTTFKGKVFKPQADKIITLGKKDTFIIQKL